MLSPRFHGRGYYGGRGSGRAPGGRGRGGRGPPPPPPAGKAPDAAHYSSSADSKKESSDNTAAPPSGQPPSESAPTSSKPFGANSSIFNASSSTAPADSAGHQSSFPFRGGGGFMKARGFGRGFGGRQNQSFPNQTLTNSSNPFSGASNNGPESGAAPATNGGASIFGGRGFFAGRGGRGRGREEGGIAPTVHKVWVRKDIEPAAPTQPGSG